MTFAEFLALPMTVSLVSLVAYGVGWLFFFGAMFGIFFILKSTPAWPFLKASFTRNPVLQVVFRDGTSDFKVGKQEIAGTAIVRKVGPFQLTENSFVRDRRSRVALYTAFAESATTITKEYAAMIQELQEMGLNIKKFADYDKFIKFISNKTDVKTFIETIEDKKKQKLVVNKLSNMKNMMFEVRGFKTYNAHQLLKMFPYNMNPAFVEAYAVAKVNLVMRKHQFNKDLLMMGSVAVFILIIGCVIAYKFIGDGDPGAVSVVCQFPEVISNVTHIAVNGTGSVMTT